MGNSLGDERGKRGREKSGNIFSHTHSLNAESTEKRNLLERPAHKQGLKTCVFCGAGAGAFILQGAKDGSQIWHCPIAFSLWPLEHFFPRHRGTSHTVPNKAGDCEARPAGRRPRLGRGARVRSGQAVPGETPEHQQQQQQQPRAPAAPGSSRRRSGPGASEERARSGPGAGGAGSTAAVSNRPGQRERRGRRTGLRGDCARVARGRRGDGTRVARGWHEGGAGTARELRGDSLAGCGWRGQLFARAVTVPAVSQRFPSGFPAVGARRVLRCSAQAAESVATDASR